MNPNDPGSIEEPEEINVQGADSVTEDEVLQRSRSTRYSHMHGANPDQGDSDRGGKYAAAIQGLGFRPEPVPFAKFSISESQEAIMPAGFYLLSGGTGGGKSITAAAIALAASTHGVPTRYVYCYEARTPAGAVVTDGASYASMENPFFSEQTKSADSDLRMTKFTDYLPDALGFMSDTGVGVVVIDSIALPLRAYRSRDRQNMATMKEGLQPMDIAFVVAMEQFAVSRNLAIIGVVNDDLVPFANKLEGMAEGVIIVHSPGRFSMRTRYDRMVHEYKLDDNAVEAGAMYLHYPVKESKFYSIFGTEGI